MKTFRLFVLLLVLGMLHPLQSQTVTNDIPDRASPIHHRQHELDAPDLNVATNVSLASAADMRKLFQITGKNDLFKQITAEFVRLQKKSAPDVPQEFWDQFLNESNLNELIKSATPIYQKYFTENDVKGIIAFNESPLGQKLITLTPQLTKEMMQVGANWGETLQHKIELACQQTNSNSFATRQSHSTDSVPNANPIPSPAANTGTFRPLTPEEAEEVRARGFDPSHMVAGDKAPGIGQPQQTSATATPSDLKNAMIWMDSFLGMTNTLLRVDVICMKPESLQFQLIGKDYDYSGHYTVMLNKPREHKNPHFGFGSPATAKLIILEDFGGESMPLSDATIWEQSKGFIDAVAAGNEWIHSGGYTIQK